ncbi:MAG TPA: hypothetical protein VJT31_34965 [Rugosimonospora sp.]|nr:hypothetical protein [Rugosimonospora sp.]
MYDVRPLVDQVSAPLTDLTTELAAHPAVVELHRRLAVVLDGLHDAARAAADAAEAGIGLYREYVDVHGYAEDAATTAAIAEVRQGTEAIAEIPGRLDSAAYATRFTYGSYDARTGARPVHAERRGRDAWVIRQDGLLRARDGQWVPDAGYSQADEEYLAATRYPRAEALREAAHLADPEQH